MTPPSSRSAAATETMAKAVSDGRASGSRSAGVSNPVRSGCTVRSVVNHTDSPTTMLVAIANLREA